MKNTLILFLSSLALIAGASAQQSSTTIEPSVEEQIETRLSDHDSEVRKLWIQRNINKRRIKQLEELRSNASELLVTVEGEIKKQNSLLESFGTQLSALEQLSKQNAQELNTLRQGVKERDAEIKTLAQEADTNKKTLEEQLTLNTTGKQTLSTVEGELSKHSSTLQSLNTQVATLKQVGEQNARELQGIATNLKADSNEVKNLMNREAISKKKIEELESQLAKQSTALDSLTKQLTSLKQSGEQNTQELKSIKDNAKDSRDQVKQLMAKVESQGKQQQALQMAQTTANVKQEPVAAKSVSESSAMNNYGPIASIILALLALCLSLAALVRGKR